MRALLPLRTRKKGNFLYSTFHGKKALSNIVGYVLLISITISLSVIVYGWLRFYVSSEEIDTCSDNVNLIIRSYECFLPVGGVGGRIEVTLKNKGLFTVDGYELRVNDREGADFGIWLFDKKGVNITPGEEYTKLYNFTDDSFFILNGLNKFEDDPLEKVTLVEVQPFIVEKGNGSIRCKGYASQPVVCGG